MGHITIDDIEAKEGFARGVPGGAPFFGAFAASRSHKRIAVVTRMAKEDEGYLAPLKDAGIDVYLRPVEHTIHMRIVHPTANVDERLIYQTKNAGFFSLEDLPPLEPVFSSPRCLDRPGVYPGIHARTEGTRFSLVGGYAEFRAPG